MGFDSELTEAAQIKFPLSREQPRLLRRMPSRRVKVLRYPGKHSNYVQTIGDGGPAQILRIGWRGHLPL